MRRSKFFLILAQFIWIATTVSVSSCSANKSTQSEVDRAMSMINQRQYDQAESILDAEHSKNPGNHEITVLLAEAELGEAHFEIFDFITQIMQGQDPSKYVDLSIRPECDSQEITKIQGYDVRCLLVRVLQHLPNVEDPHFVRAEALLKDAFPNADGTPEEVNFLIAFVDVVSTLHSGRTLLLKSNEKDVTFNSEGQVSEEQFRLLVHNAKIILANTKDGVERLKYSYGKLRKIVFGESGQAVVKIGNRELDFNQALDTQDIVEFIGEIVHDHLDSINQQADSVADDTLRSINYEAGDVVARFSNAFLNDGKDHHPVLDVAWRFDQAFEWILRNIAQSPVAGGSTSASDMLWKHPPELFMSLRDASVQAWQQETREPLFDYFRASRDQWEELRWIMDGWDQWLNKDLSEEQRYALKEQIVSFVKGDSRFTLPPNYFTLTQLEAWEKDLTEALRAQMLKALDNQFSSIPQFSEEQAERGKELLTRSSDWIDKNLWTISSSP